MQEYRHQVVYILYSKTYCVT